MKKPEQFVLLNIDEHTRKSEQRCVHDHVLNAATYEACMTHEDTVLHRALTVQELFEKLGE